MSGLVLIYIVGPYTWLGNLFNDDLTGTVAGVVLAQTFVAGPFLDHRRADGVRGRRPRARGPRGLARPPAGQPGSGWCRCASPRRASAPGC